MKNVAHIGPKIDIDTQALVDSRLLIQANSGGGKSYAIRKLLEETHGKVQQIVIDIEGDFSSLREQFDYVLAGKGGDIPADPRSAEMLATKLLELKADTIIDLYELKQHERIRFVKLFLDAMVNAPKNLWHPVLVVLDEAHIFCPEKGSSEAMGAVIDICTRGRKRGFCAVLATQRISKLHKDAAAECNNKMIGRTGLDIDMKRAADELGLPVNKTTNETLRNMKPGEFYVFGPAISKSVTLGKIGEVKTTHAKAGQRGLGHKPPASQTVKEKLAKLSDLPEAAAEEIRDRDELRSRIKTLERELKAKPKEPVIDQVQMKAAIEKALAVAKKEFDNQTAAKFKEVSKEIRESVAKILGETDLGVYIKPVPMGPVRPSVVMNQILSTSAPKPKKAVQVDIDPDEKLSTCESKILGFLSSQPERSFSKIQTGAMTGYKHSSGGFNNSLSRLNQRGMIIRNNGQIQISDDGRQWVHHNGQATPHTLEDWVNKLSSCERKIYELVLSRPEDTLTKEEISQLTGYAVGSGGFNNSLSRLNTLGLITRDRGNIKLNADIWGLT